MSNHPYTKQYKTMSITTATRGQILIMLYEGAIQNVKRAIVCIEKKDIPGKGVAIGKTHDIINELLNTLDFEIGGNIAKDLERIYHFIIEKLIESNIAQSVSSLKDIQKLLEDLLEAWRDAVAQVNQTVKK